MRAINQIKYGGRRRFGLTTTRGWFDLSFYLLQILKLDEVNVSLAGLKTLTRCPFDLYVIACTCLCSF